MFGYFTTLCMKGIYCSDTEKMSAKENNGKGHGSEAIICEVEHKTL